MLKLTLKGLGSNGINASNSNSNASNSTSQSTTNSTSQSTTNSNSNPQQPKLKITLSTPSANPILPPSGMEDHFLLRLPPSLASLLSSALTAPEEEEEGFLGALKMRFVSPRMALLQHPRFVKPGYVGLLMDSPTVMETLKNPGISVSYGGITSESSASDAHFNVGQYYKVADVAQVLVVLDLDSPEGQRLLARLPLSLQQRAHRLASHPEAFDSVRVGIARSEAAEEAESPVWAQLSDGLTPPLRAAERRKFAPRPLAASRVGEMERVEREVERLLKEDSQLGRGEFTLYSPTGEILLGDGVGDGLDDLEGDLEFEEEEGLDLEGEEQDEIEDEGEQLDDIDDTSDDEEIQFEDFAAEIEDNLMQDIVTEKQEEEPVPAIPAESTNEKMVRELEAKLQEKLRQAESVSNPLIKARIEDVIKQLEDNLRHLREQ